MFMSPDHDRALAPEIRTAAEAGGDRIDTRRDDAGRDAIARAHHKHVPPRLQFLYHRGSDARFDFEHARLGAMIVERAYRVQRVHARRLYGRLDVHPEVDHVEENQQDLLVLAVTARRAD